MTRKLLFVLFMGSMPFLYSCDKLKGEIGPAGEQGEQGIQGEKGDPGDPAGAIQVTLDTASTDANGDLARGFEVGAANAAIVEKGAVLVYAKTSIAWFPLPGPIIFADGVSNYTFAYVIQGANLVVQLLQLDEVPKKRKFQAVRVVLIPAANARLNADIDYKDYEAVRKAYNLPE
ncbi:collagen-like protein [Persicitalea jodogahamensis]|uniref:Collagen-like protein n=1 Tax=Persicitalea jodogahamensis TaxID=402147 RepID=A0A8J3GC09_9BACT|nr:collagen-like protein [Persicitalea jodogahamensis]GHB81272.1 hypothetical protein GCM10007390_40060 [Persicitalea jodogahamensis]